MMSLQPVAVDVVDEDRVRGRDVLLGLADAVDDVVGVEDPLALGRVGRRLVPAGGRDDVHAAVAVDVAQAVAVMLALGADDVLDEPGLLVDVLQPGHALAFAPGPSGCTGCRRRRRR